MWLQTSTVMAIIVWGQNTKHNVYNLIKQSIKIIQHNSMKSFEKTRVDLRSLYRFWSKITGLNLCLQSNFQTLEKRIW